MPHLNPDPQASKSLYLVTAIAAVVFLGLYIVQLRNDLRIGRNYTPLHVLVKSSDGQEVPNGIQIFAVTPWSEMELVRRGDVWGLPENKIRAVPSLTIRLPPESNVEKLQAHISIATAPRVENEITAPDHWIAARIQTNEAVGQNGYELDTAQTATTTILNLMDRRCINWAGDFHLLSRATIVPATRIGFFWLAFAGAIWFRGAMKAAPVVKKPLSKSNSDSAGGRINGLDHIRGCAILMVVAYHCLFATFGYDQLGWDGWFRNFDHDSRTFLALAPVTFGFGGVAVFFALSGFCIHLSYQRSSDKSWMKYIWRRLFRIYPPFLVALLFFAFFFPLTMVDFSSNGLQQFYSRVFLYFNLAPHSYWGINSSFWSVAVEMQLYLVYPFLLIAAHRFGWRPVLIAAFLVEIGLQFPASELRFLAPELKAPFALLRGPLGYVFSWLIGAKLADDFVAGRPLLLRRVPMWVWFSLLTLSLTFKPAAPFQFVLFSLTTVGCTARFAEGKSFGVPIPEALSKHIAWVGMLSYSLYLLHQPFLNLAPKITRWLWADEFVHPGYRLASCLMMYPLIVGLSWLMYRFVELPSIAAGKWFVSNEARTPDPTAPAGALETPQIGLGT